jgi:hypothetical protein
MYKTYIYLGIIALCFIVLIGGYFTFKFLEPRIISCKTEGQSFYDEGPFATYCCPGLKKINVQQADYIGSRGFCTNLCGNKECNSEIETNYNCPNDCN